MGDAQPRAQRLGQGRDRPRHHLREDARPLAAAQHQQRKRIVARRDIGRARTLAHLGAHGVAGRGARDARRQRHRPDPAGDPLHPGRKHRVDAPEHAVLFVDHPRDAQKPRRPQRRDRGIAAEPHHHRGPVAAHRAPGRRDPGRDPQGHERARHHPAAGKGRRGRDLDRDLWRKAPGKARASRIGRQPDPPAAHDQHFGQRLGGEHVPARSPRGDDDAPARPHLSAPDGAGYRPSRPAADSASAPGAPPPSTPPRSARIRHSSRTAASCPWRAAAAPRRPR